MTDPQESSGSADPVAALRAVGAHRFLDAAVGEVDAFVADRATELEVLREDVQGRFRNPGLLRGLTMLMLVPSVVPLIGQTHYRLAGGGFEFAGMLSSFACALLLTIIVVRSSGHPFDKHSFITFYWTAISCGGGALFAWWNGIPQPLLAQFAVASTIVVGLVTVLQITRSRNIIAGRMRDEDAMDRSERMRQVLAGRLESLADQLGPAASEELAEEFIDELVSEAVPKPRNRTFGEASEPIA